MKPIRIFRHQAWIEPGRLTEFLDSRGVPWELVCMDKEDPVPQQVDDVSGLAFLGGTMSVNDGLSWLDEEMQLIRKATASGLPMLGHCLGSQLIAKALGGTVAPMPNKEIGWHQVQMHDSAEARAWLPDVPERFELLIWHHDAYSLPPGAQPLYSSAYCPEQAYVLGNTVATVAHAEVTPEMLEAWLDIYGYDIEPSSPSVQPVEQIRENIIQRCATMHAQFTDRLYDAWLARVTTHAQV